MGRGAFIDRYLVLSLLGRGGMGEVYAAYDPELDRRVALKLLHASGSEGARKPRTADKHISITGLDTAGTTESDSKSRNADKHIPSPGLDTAGTTDSDNEHIPSPGLPTARGLEGGRERLVREARALGKLSHPNVVQVHDVGEHEGDVFVAMELVEGASFKVWCRRAPKPVWQEVLSAYLDAARGLSAAHKKGLVHRDVKPANILRSNDGRVCVVDFGLARYRACEGAMRAAKESPADDETMPIPAGMEGRIEEPLTATGALMGTPIYMAPEQYEGPNVGPASDQYSLCIALYEGLYGAPPFTAKLHTGIDGKQIQPHDLYKQKMSGLTTPPPAGTPVPAWIHRALVRGLAPRPEDRYPSMEALIAALREDPDARRRGRLLTAGIGVGAAAMLAISGVAVGKSGALKDPCGHPERQLSGVWDEAVKGRVRAAFLGADRPYASDTATRVEALLDRYGADWAAMRGEVCEASRSDNPRREILGLRDRCLDRRRGQLQALTALFTEKPDVQILEKAVPAASRLYPVAYCADTEALSARVRPPEDPALRARVAALEPKVDRLEALDTAGKYKEGEALGEALLAETAGLPYPPLRAQVQYWTGRLRDGIGDHEGGKTLLREAIISAAEGKDDVLVATAWARLLFVVGEHQRRFDEASVIRALGLAAVARAQEGQTEDAWLSAEAVVLHRMGKYVEAKALHERVLALREKALGPFHPDVATSLNNLGTILRSMGDYPQARATHERALALREKALGPFHPYVATSLNNLANVLCDMGDYPQALAIHERVLALREKALGPDHLEVIQSLYNIGNQHYVMGDFPAALAMHERALALNEKALGPFHPEVAQSLTAVGNDLFEMGTYLEARARYERALAILEKTLGPDHPHVAYALVGLGRALERLGQLEAALVLLERGRTVREKGLGASNPDVTESLLGLGELYLARRKPEEAEPLLERALTLNNAQFKAEIQLTLADVLWQLDKDRPRSRALAEQARAAYERIGHRPGLGRASRWLAEHHGAVTTAAPPP